MVNSFSAALRKRPLDIPKGGAFVVKRRKKAERYKLFLIEGFLDKYFERFWNRFLKNFSRSDKNPAFFPRYASKAAARHPEGWRFQSEAGKESRAIAVPYQGTLNVFPLPYK